MGTSNSTEEQPREYYHNVLFLQEVTRTMAFHFHAGEYETFKADKMPCTGLVTLGYTTLGFDEVDRALRDNTYRTTNKSGGASYCYPPLCWTQDKLRDMGVPVINDSGGSVSVIAGYNRLLYGTMTSESPSSACPLVTRDF